MRVDVYQLPAHALSVQSFSARGLEPYLDAHEELRAAVATALAEGGDVPEVPFSRVALTIVCYVGTPRQDGRYRAQRVHTLHYTLDPIYRALLDSGTIAGMEAVYAIRTVLVRDAPREGFRIEITELAADA